MSMEIQPLPQRDFSACGLAENLSFYKVAKGRLKADDLLVLKGMKLTSVSLSGSKLKDKDWLKLRAAFPHTVFKDKDSVDSETKYVFRSTVH